MEFPINTFLLQDIYPSHDICDPLLYNQFLVTSRSIRIEIFFFGILVSIFRGYFNIQVILIYFIFTWRPRSSVSTHVGHRAKLIRLHKAGTAIDHIFCSAIIHMRIQIPPMASAGC
jgi:hypothetical protein